MLHLTDHTDLRDLPTAAPFVHVGADLIGNAPRAIGRAVAEVRAREVSRVRSPHRSQRLWSAHRNPGQRPEISRGAIGVLEAQRFGEALATGDGRRHRQDTSDKRDDLRYL